MNPHCQHEDPQSTQTHTHVQTSVRQQNRGAALFETAASPEDATRPPQGVQPAGPTPGSTPSEPPPAYRDEAAADPGPSGSRERVHHCGRPLRPDAEYCDRCGERVVALPPAASLAVLDNEGNVVQTIPLLEDQITIGSGPQNSIVLSGDRYVSSRHAQLIHSDEGFVIEDLNSTNGTFLRIQRQMSLEGGDEIRIGTTVLRFDRPVQGKPQGGRAGT